MTYFDEVYIKDDTCPCCGTYTPDGDVCKVCLDKYGLNDDRMEKDYVECKHDKWTY